MMHTTMCAVTNRAVKFESKPSRSSRARLFFTPARRSSSSPPPAAHARLPSEIKRLLAFKSHLNSSRETLGESVPRRFSRVSILRSKAISKEHAFLREEKSLVGFSKFLLKYKRTGKFRSMLPELLVRSCFTGNSLDPTKLFLPCVRGFQ